MATNIYSLIIVLGVLVFIHEFGHFLFARLFGVGVEKFSLGFGPRLFGKKIGMTDYIVSAIPLGGYVKMVGEDPESELEPEKRPLSFTHKPVWQRIIIVAAGPVFNYILAVVIFFGMLITLGDDGFRPVVGTIEPDSPALAAGLQSGDVITQVAGKPVVIWNDISEHFEKADKGQIPVTVLRNGKELTLSVEPVSKTGQDILGDEIDIVYMGAQPYQKVLIAHVAEESPALEAGLLKGDVITHVSNEPLQSWSELVTTVMESDGKPIDFTISRGEKTFQVAIRPDIHKTDKEEIYRIGIERAFDTITKKMGVIASAKESVLRTYQLTDFMIRALGKIITGQLPRSELGGPIMIAKMAGDHARAGVDKFIAFIALISINLAILNFLPIPVLDGGHLLFFTIELVKGSPVSIRTREMAQQAGMFILLLLMVFVFYNDITRLLSG